MKKKRVISVIISLIMVFDQLFQCILVSYAEREKDILAFEGENYKIVAEIVEIWEGAYIAKVEINNIGECIIDNWALYIKSNDHIVDVYNGTIDLLGDEDYIIKNAHYNQDIHKDHHLIQTFLNHSLADILKLK